MKQQILQYLANHGPCSCHTLALALNLDRQRVYRFLYRARCYGGGKGWVDNVKPIPSVTDPGYSAALMAPGQYTITPAGLDELVNDASVPAT